MHYRQVTAVIRKRMCSCVLLQTLPVLSFVLRKKTKPDVVLVNRSSQHYLNRKTAAMWDPNLDRRAWSGGKRLYNLSPLCAFGNQNLTSPVLFSVPKAEKREEEGVCSKPPTDPSVFFHAFKKTPSHPAGLPFSSSL